MDHSQKTKADVNANASMGGFVVVEVVVIGDVGTLQQAELGGMEVDSFGMPSCIVYIPLYVFCQNQSSLFSTTATVTVELLVVVRQESLAYKTQVSIVGCLSLVVSCE